jgi:6-phosphogluconolactonase
MKFTKFGKALMMSALSAGLILGISSCVQSYTVGFLYVTGTVTAQTGSNGIISGFRIDHNTGYLRPINQFPVGSGGSNPVRAVLLGGSRFLYVLNRGVNAEGNSNCTTADPCKNSNITQFAVGGNGILTPQQTFFTQGLNPFRLLADSTGSYLLVLDHDSVGPNGQASSSTNPNPACALALGPKVTACAEITVFKIDSTTGRLSLVTNAQVTSASGTPITYFPVPSNPIDFVMAPGFVLTVSGTPATGDSVFPYTYGTNGQLTLNQNTSQPLGIYQATAIVNAGGNIYVLDNEPPNPNPNQSVSQLLIFTVGTGGALQAQTTGVVPDDPSLANPIWVIQESKSHFVYVANAASNPSVTPNPNPNGGIAGYSVTSSPNFQLTQTDPTTFGTGSAPQCLVEDPSDQYVYTANMGDSTVTGRLVDPNAGVLNTLRKGSKFNLAGPPTWCLINGRTD